MNRIIRFLLLLAAVLLVSCSAKNMAGGAQGSPQDPFFPATSSILPLVKGNNWTYSYTRYDTNGNIVVPHRLDWRVAIPAQFGMQNDTTLVRLDLHNYENEFQAYAYAYERDNTGKGFLVVYRQYDLGVRGLYIIGVYDDSVIHLYPKEQPWLLYPAQSGATWQLKSDPLGDTSAVTSMELISTSARSYKPESGVMAGISFVDSCYCYKETRADSVSYYYYNKDIGAISYERYVGGKRFDTYILTSYYLRNQ
jgi:hypothetical protein